MTSGVRRVDLSHVLLSPTDRWGTFLAGVFDLDEDICERANRILRQMAARSVVHCLAGELDYSEAVLLASVDHRDRTVGHIELLGVRPDPPWPGSGPGSRDLRGERPGPMRRRHRALGGEPTVLRLARN